jgi:hypothetical protein
VLDKRDANCVLFLNIPTLRDKGELVACHQDYTVAHAIQLICQS